MVILPCLLWLSTAGAQPEPDMDGSGCVDLFDVALFQNLFGTRDHPGLAPCDFIVDGYCNLNDYVDLASVFRGPICDCTADTDCNDSYPCTIDECYSGACRNTITCPNQDDSDADCIHEYCTIAGCVAADEPTGSPCDDGIPCTSGDRCGTPGDSSGCAHGVADDSLCGSQDHSDGDCLRPICEVGYPFFGCTIGPEPPGSPCHDGIACTTGDHCGTPADPWACAYEVADDSLCDNQNHLDADCVTGVCWAGYPFYGCTIWSEPSGSPCDDGIACTTQDSCRRDQSGEDICVGVSDDSLCGNQDHLDADCVAGVCWGYPFYGCTIWSEPPGSPCDDGVDCTDQSCVLGECVIVPIDARCGNDDNADADCIRADCDPDAGCILAIEPDGSACEDGIACTGSDYCSAGQCYGGIYYDFLCPNQDYCDDDCIQYYCDPGQGCVQGVEFASAPCLDFFCALNDQYSACTASGFCECRAQPPPDFGCP